MRESRFGTPLLPAELGARLVRALPSTRAATSPIEWRKFCLNGTAPSAQFQNLLHEATNNAVVHRTRQIFWGGSPTALLSSAAASRARYRFAFRTSTYHNNLKVIVVTQPPESTYASSASYVRLKIFSDATETTVAATVDFHHGASPGGSASTVYGWNYAKITGGYVTGLTPNTDYYGTFYDENNARLQTATVIETQSMTEHIDGYLPTSLNQDSEVLSVYREKVATIQKELWKNSGSHVLNWTVDNGTSPITRTSTTAINIVDNSSTSVSASTPGYTIDMRNKTRRSEDGVPCVMKAFGKMASGSNKGAVYLVDSAGNTVDVIFDLWGATPQWQSTSFTIPATLDKYDLRFSRGSTADAGNPFSLYAVSIYELG
jgi:hypothetical protein